MSASPAQPENPSCCTNCASPTVPSTASSARLAHTVSTCRPRAAGPAHQPGTRLPHRGILWNGGARIAGHPGPALATPGAAKVLEPRAGGPRERPHRKRLPGGHRPGEGPRGVGPLPVPRPQRGAKAAHSVPPTPYQPSPEAGQHRESAVAREGGLVRPYTPAAPRRPLQEEPGTWEGRGQRSKTQTRLRCGGHPPAEVRRSPGLLARRCGRAAACI